MSQGLYKTVGGKGEQKSQEHECARKTFHLWQQARGAVTAALGDRHVCTHTRWLALTHAGLHSHMLACMHTLSLTHTTINSTGRLLPEASPAPHWSLLMTNICEVAGVERQLGPGEPFCWRGVKGRAEGQAGED